MKKQHFFRWYYDRGLHELLEILKNYILYFAHYFSPGELLSTLFSPWHRDIKPKDWRGFNPKKSLERLAENLMSRIIGGIIRFLVMISGIFVILVVIAFAITIIFIWLTFPILFLVGTYYVSIKLIDLKLFSGLIGAYLIMTVGAFWRDIVDENRHMTFAQLKDHHLHNRLCDRLGIAKEKLSIEVLQNEQVFAEILRQCAISQKEFNFIMQQEFLRDDAEKLKAKFWRWENLSKERPLPQQWKYAYTVNLDNYGIDLSDYDPTEYRSEVLIGRADELSLLQIILERPDQNNALIIGPAGIGKKTLLHNLARAVRENRAGNYLKEKRLILLDLGRAISDAINRGEDVENHLRILFYEAAYAGNIVLVIEHLEHYLGREGNMYHPEISSVLSEFLNLPSFQIIATSTPREYHNLIEKQESVTKYFEIVEMREPSYEEVLQILMSHFAMVEQRRIIFTYSGLRAIIHDSEKFNWQFPLPERAIDLATNVLTYWQQHSDGTLITEEVVAQFLSMKTGVPQGEIHADERKKLLNLEQLMHRHVIGQEEAIKEISVALRRARSGISNQQKPIGSFLFLGPTGVGKTETAKALAKIYFGSEEKMIRLDMSEYQMPNSLDRLIGNAQLNQQGQLVNKVKDNPYGLLLLDEIEKAYPEILDIFLQVLDEGFFTDAFGERINFRNMIIIATSNVGAPLIKEMVTNNAKPEEIKTEIIDYAVQKGIYRLEFLNRFTGVIFFRPLIGKELFSVVKLMLKKLQRRILKEKNIEIEFDDAIIESVIAGGYDPIFGARSLDRYVQDTVEDVLAKEIIAGNVKKGERVRIG